LSDPAIYWGFDDGKEIAVELFIRAKNRNDVKIEIRELLPNVKFCQKD